MSTTMGITGTSGTGGEQQKAARPGGELDKQAFLRLLVTQMRYQNPLEPMDNKEYIAQLAQFSSLEQMQGMAKNVEAMAAGQEEQSILAAAGQWQMEQMHETLRQILAVQEEILARLTLDQTA